MLPGKAQVATPTQPPPPALYLHCQQSCALSRACHYSFSLHSCAAPVPFPFLPPSTSSSLPPGSAATAAVAVIVAAAVATVAAATLVVVAVVVTAHSVADMSPLSL